MVDIHDIGRESLDERLNAAMEGGHSFSRRVNTANNEVAVITRYWGVGKI